MAARTVVGLAAERLRRIERRLDALERRVDAQDAQLAEVAELLTRLVRVVAVASRQSRRTTERLDTRVKRLTRDVTAARTADLRRLAALARRLS
jgi:uncharacterized coiled-coil protein SlyX